MDNKTKAKMPKTVLIEFMKENCNNLTIGEVMAQSGWSYQTLQILSNQEGIKFINIKDKVRRFIRANTHLTFDQMAKELDFAHNTLQIYLKEENITLSHTKTTKKHIVNSRKTTTRRNVYLGPIAQKYADQSFLDAANKLLYGEGD